MRSRRIGSVLMIGVVAFWVTLACAQAPPALQQRPAPAVTPQTAAASSAPPAPNVAPTAAVITLDGVCENPPATAVRKAGDCTTIVTRAVFEKMIDALDPNMAPAARRTLAENYAKIAIVATDARNHGLEDDPKFQDVLRFLRIQTLANLYNQQLQRAALEVPPQEAENYYKAHEANFEEVTLRRIFIAKSVPNTAKQLSDAERTALAEGLQKRATAGEDFDKLQQEAYTALGIKGTPPSTNVPALRRGAMPALQEGPVFGLKPGEVSPVLSDSIADYIYKLESRRTVPLDAAKPEIQRAIASERYQAAIGKVFSGAKAQLNSDYFPGPSDVALPGQPSAPPVARPNPPQPK